MRYAVANLKMKFNKEETINWFEKWHSLENNFKNLEVIIAPSHIHLNLMEGLTLSAQDISIYDKGSHTGEIGGFQLKEYVTYVIVGHSERKEDRETVINKANNCKQNGLIPIICFTEPNLANQYYLEGSILAWEDPGNIAAKGIFKPKDPVEILRGIEIIREHVGEDTVLLYGGSVNKENIEALYKMKGVNGALIGTAALDPEHFLEICKVLNK